MLEDDYSSNTELSSKGEVELHSRGEVEQAEPQAPSCDAVEVQL
jgi:hypothetical protein